LTPQKNIKKPVCLQIIPSMGIGGVETGVRNIAEYLKKKKIKNFILCESSHKNLESANLNIIYLKNLYFKNFFHQKKIKIFLKDLINKNKINLVHISSRAPAFFLINFLKRMNIKIVTSVHNKYKSDNFIKSWYNNHLLRGDHIIFNSHFVQNSYKNLLANNLKLTVISRGIDTNYFQSKKSLNKLKNYLFIPSRISSWKGHDLLIDYYLKLPKKYKENFMLLFISSHASKDEIKIDKIIKKNNLMNKIEFIKPTLDIKKVYETCFLVINMSIRPEGFGRTVSESLSMSCPVIAPNMGGTREQLKSFNSRLLFDINSFSSFFKALKYAINNRKEISKNARNYVVENYSSELMCKNTLEIYKNLIN